MISWIVLLILITSIKISSLYLIHIRSVPKAKLGGTAHHWKQLRKQPCPITKYEYAEAAERVVKPVWPGIYIRLQRVGFHVQQFIKANNHLYQIVNLDTGAADQIYWQSNEPECAHHKYDDNGVFNDLLSFFSVGRQDGIASLINLGTLCLKLRTRPGPGIR